MQFVSPIPFHEAIDKLGDKSPIGAALSSAQWSAVPVALRERAMFSASVESIRFLARTQELLGDFLEAKRETLPTGEVALKTGGRAQFVQAMREFAIAEGMGPLDPKDAGTIKDIQSQKRLELIFDTQVKQAHEFGNWKQGMDADVLDEFPAQRFIRVVDVDQPRDPHKPVEGAVVLKTDLAFWIRVNEDFGVPWGPWGWGCGHDVEDVDRTEAEQIGLLTHGQAVQPVEKDFNEHLQASVRNLDPELQELLKKSFGNQVKIENGAAWWKGDRTGKKLAGVAPRSRRAPVTEPVIDPNAWPDDLSRLEIVRQLGGSTGAELVKDPRTGRMFVRKMGNSPGHLREEFAADQIYRAAGVPVPEVRLYDGDAPVKLAEFIEGRSLREVLAKGPAGERQAVLGRVREHFAVDALLGNWDVAGLDLDNILVDATGKPWRIDNGGSLRFRAQGALKSAAEWHEFPTELWSMRDATKPAGKVFQGLGIFDIGRQIEALDGAKILAAAPDDVKALLGERLAHLRALGTKALDLQHDGWRESYAEELTRHMLGLRQAGIVRDLPKTLTQAAGGVQPVDENGVPFDDLRTHAGTGTDPYWNDLLAAVKTLNKHGADGDFAYNQQTVQKALAHKAVLQQLVAGKNASMGRHYLAVLDYVEKAKLAADGKRFVKIGQVNPFTQKGNESLVKRVSDYMVSQGAKQEIVAEWMESQAGSSWDDQAQAFKVFIGRQLEIDPSDAYWRDGVAAAENYHRTWLGRWGSDGERALTIWHAFVQEVLGNVTFDNNDRMRRAVRLIRTEKKEIISRQGIKQGAQRRMRRGLNESSSIFRTTRVHGTEITVQAVPHSRVTGLYLLERRPSSAGSSFLGDGENEFTFVPYGLPFNYLKSAVDSAGQEAAGWGLDLAHLRNP